MQKSDQQSRTINPEEEGQRLNEELELPVAQRTGCLQAAPLVAEPVCPAEHGEAPSRQDFPTPDSIADAAGHVRETEFDVRGSFLPAILLRVEAIERAGVALLEGRLLPGLREKAEREAHRLAALLDALGYAPGSRFAREIERLLNSGAEVSESQALRFSELTVALRLDVENRPVAVLPSGSGEKQAALLVIAGDDGLTEHIEAEAVARALCVQTVRSLETALEAVAAHAPSVILLDLAVCGQEDQGVSLLAELSVKVPSTPVIVLSSKNGFTDRLEVARHGGRGFLSRTSSSAGIIQAAIQLISGLDAGEARILAVDDDPQDLAIVRALLEPRHVCLETLDDPLRFWDTLRSFAPDLLLLEADMPHLSGVDLCRVVRNDAVWAETPVIFFIEAKDAETLRRVFTAGADDFVAKPIVGPELLARVFSRLERLRLTRSRLETDPVTGAWNRRKGSQMITSFLDLARRHGQPFCLAAIHAGGLKGSVEQNGRGARDAALGRVSRALSEGLRAGDVLARWSDDCFVMGMYGLTRYDTVQRLTQLLEAARHEGTRFPAEGLPIILNAGIAQYGEDGGDLEALSRAAEAALMRAKAAGEGKVAHAGWPESAADSDSQVDVALVMGDEAQASLLLHELRSRGYRARWLQDGETALKLLAGPEPRLRSKVVLIDVELAGVDGIALLERLAWDGVLEDCRAIVMAAPSVADERQAALDLGAVDYVVKPFNPPVVVQHIRRALEAARENR